MAVKLLRPEQQTSPTPSSINVSQTLSTQITKNWITSNNDGIQYRDTAHEPVIYQAISSGYEVFDPCQFWMCSKIS